ncbi:hypothetical protein [Saccharomonospora saliphila]|uniref:hypothetical protein n=1 Tax=Saccharomonospora saliphila TaxID=369829 RepID=UPI001E299B75|nr:hypothetical protein [Saccharomonospora saliphila]
MSIRAGTRGGSVLGLVVLGAVVPGLLGGCAGEDLSKANFERTTVRAEPRTGQGAVPAGPIDDPAVALERLRGVDACALLSGPAVSGYTEQEDPRRVDWGVCRRTLVDVGGKEFSLWLDLGQTSSATDATGEVAGLPLVERTDGDTTCYATAITSRETDLGITVWADYPDGGDSCGTATSVLAGVVERLRTDPPSAEQPEGSLREADPCGVVSDDVRASVFDGESTARPAGLHVCALGEGRATLRVTFRVGFPIQDAPEDGERITLAGGATAVREPGTTETAECDVRWQHRGIDEYEAELVGLSYYDYSEAADTASACAHVTRVAEDVMTTLPSG